MILIALSCAWVIGIFLGSMCNTPLALIGAGILPVPFLWVFKKQRKALVLLSLCLIALFGAAAYYPHSAPMKLQVPLSLPAVVEIRGIVDTPPEVGDKLTHVEISVQEIKTGSSWENSQGKILIFIPHYPEYQYGDILWVKGRLENPPSFASFDYQAYLAQEGIYFTMLQPQINVQAKGAGARPLEWIYSLRERSAKSLSAALPEPQASLAQGIVLGLRSTIPDDLKHNLSITGTAQLLAISGINLSIIAGILVTIGLWLFGRRYYIYVWLALLIIWVYSLLTGMQPPVIRSAIMASVFLMAELLGRQKNAFVAMAFSAAIMVAITPRVLWDVSFQLSFLAIAGLIFIAPPIQELGRRAVHRILADDGFASPAAIVVTDSFSITIGALVAVWPLIALNFGIFSVVGPLSNFLIAPALSPIIILGAITAFVGIISMPVAQVIGWIAWIFLSYMIWMINVFASLPLASIGTGGVSNDLKWIYYGALTVVIAFKTNYRKLSQLIKRISDDLKTGTSGAMNSWTRLPKKWVIIPLLAAAFLTSFTAATMPDNDLHVSALDVGEGDAILIQTGSQNLLIDGGPSPQAVTLALGRHLPFWNRNIDMIILTHPHLDHLSGLIEVLQRYRVTQILAPNLSSTDPSFRQWTDLLRAKNIPCTLACSGQQITLKDGTRLDIINPPDTSTGKRESDLENGGIAAKLTRDKISFLFTADIGQEAETRLLSQRADLASTVLKVAHHGSATSTGPDFLAVVRPQVAVISVGKSNTFGHPSAKVIADLKAGSVKDGNVFRTDLSGTIEFISDGQSLRVKTDR
jgi:competence protein ComEC